MPGRDRRDATPSARAAAPKPRAATQILGQLQPLTARTCGVGGAGASGHGPPSGQTVIYPPPRPAGRVKPPVNRCPVPSPTDQRPVWADKRALGGRRCRRASPLPRPAARSLTGDAAAAATPSLAASRLFPARVRFERADPGLAQRGGGTRLEQHVTMHWAPQPMARRGEAGRRPTHPAREHSSGRGT